MIFDAIGDMVQAALVWVLSFLPEVEPLMSLEPAQPLINRTLSGINVFINVGLLLSGLGFWFAALQVRVVRHGLQSIFRRG